MNNINILITSDSIYAHSIAKIFLTSYTEFTISFNCEVLSIDVGKSITDSNSIVAEKNDSKYSIEANLINVFKERKINKTKSEGEENSYGMRFYPFVSSFFELEIQSSPIVVSSIILDLPDEFRIIWNGSVIFNSRNEKSLKRHAYSSERSKYLFTWAKSEIRHNDTVTLKIPIRFGGTKLLNIVNFPIYYFIIALIIVALSTFSEKSSVFLATIAGSWLFMLRKWSLSDLPQQNTFLTHLYLITGILLSFWGLFWKVFEYWAFSITPFFLLLVFYLFRVIHYFERNGVLQDNLAKYWSYLISKRVKSSFKK